MKKFTKGIITFVFALMVLAPFSVFAATEITNADLETAKGGTPTKGITYDNEFDWYSVAEGEYIFGEDINIGTSTLGVEDATVVFDLNGKTLTCESDEYGAIEVFKNANVTIKGNGTITSPIPVFGYDESIVSIENGTFNGEVRSHGHEDSQGIHYSYFNIKNGTFKAALHFEYANVVIDNGTFDTTEANQDAVYVNSGASIEINGGTFKSVSNGLMVEPGGYYDSQLGEFVSGANPKSVVINAGTFTGVEESGIGAFSVDSLEINGGTFTGGMVGLWFNDVDKITLAGGTYKATSNDAMGAITTNGEDTSALTAILGDGCSYDPAMDATVIEKWDMKYAVSQKEITVVNPNAKENTTEITVIEGADQTFTVGESDAAVFRFSADYSLFENGGKVYVDDALVDSANYTSESGSTIIKLAKEFMATLTNGTHTIKVEFNNGQVATANFVVKGSTVTNPATGDNALIYFGILALSLVSLVITKSYMNKLN